ncbi:MAG TPA: hypothetical protein VIV60_30680 [Polyangiaceae bacterium]
MARVSAVSRGASTRKLPSSVWQIRSCSSAGIRGALQIEANATGVRQEEYDCGRIVVKLYEILRSQL